MNKEVINCLTWYVNSISIIMQYDWSGDYFERETRRVRNIFINEIKMYIDFNNITKDEAIELRFRKWSDESDLYLIPLYLLPITCSTYRYCTSLNNKWRNYLRW